MRPKRNDISHHRNRFRRRLPRLEYLRLPPTLRQALDLRAPEPSRYNALLSAYIVHAPARALVRILGIIYRGRHMIDRRSTLQMERRQILKSLAIATIAEWPVLAAGRSLKGTAINHVSYASADYIRTRDFYRDVLGFQVSDEDDKQLYLWAGDALISAKNTPGVQAPFIDHFGLTVEPWDLNAVEAALKERSLVVRVSRNDPHDNQGKSAFTVDPNRYNLQLGAKDLEVKPPPLASKASLKAIGINHISYRCADYKRTCDFY